MPRQAISQSPGALKAKRHRERCPDAQRQANQRWLAKPGNREKKVASSLAWAKANPQRNAENAARWRDNNPEYLPAYRRRVHAANLLRNAKYRAKKFGLPFDITIEDIVIPELCPILGKPLIYGEGKGSGHGMSPSIDRLRPELGYVRGNINVISQKANRIKTNARPEEVMAVALWLAQMLHD
jgi:hypothetical protein